MRERIHKYIYLFGLCVIAFCLPLSEYVTNAATLLIIVNWIVELRYKEKFKKLIQNKSIIIFLLVFFTHILWLINTNNLNFALHDIKIKLPLLAFPIVIGTSMVLSRKNINLIVGVFISGVFFSTISGLFVYFDIVNNPTPQNLRDIAVFITHIRLSLMVCLSVLILFYFIHEKLFFTKWKIIIAIVLIVWFVGFLIMIQGFTGLASLLIVGWVSLGVKAHSEKKKIIKYLYFSLIIGIPLTVLSYLGYQVKTFYTPTVDQSEIKTYTEYGNEYYNDLDSKLLENGNLIYRDICEKELFSEWTKRSKENLDGDDAKEQSLFHTLIRYMTSKGYTKDAKGFSLMTDKDIQYVENGITNYRFAEHQSLNQRIYNIIWQIDVYIKGGNPSGHSITQRFEYLKAGTILASRNILFGTGTGDVEDAYEALYIEKRSQLDSKYRYRAHNQYITFFVTFGCVGAIICLFALFYPVIIEFKINNYFFAIFFLITVLSMFTDDTMETTTGVVFISYFYSLFLWSEK